MYSHEIQELLRIRNYLVSVEEYIKIVSSKQVKWVKYDPFEDKFHIATEDNYNFQLKIKKN